MTILPLEWNRENSKQVNYPSTSDAVPFMQFIEIREEFISKFPNIKNTMDIYVIAHYLGWLGKTILFRNNILIWIMSAGFEVLELSLK
jgi:hypothetical protein